MATFVQTYIFPGQQIPHLEYVVEEFAKETLEVVYMESTGLQYARTLREWRLRLQQAESARGAAEHPWSEAGFRKLMLSGLVRGWLCGRIAGRLARCFSQGARRALVLARGKNGQPPYAGSNCQT